MNHERDYLPELETFVSPYLDGWKASSPQIPGCVYRSRDRDTAVRMVRTVVIALAEDNFDAGTGPN